MVKKSQEIWSWISSGNQGYLLYTTLSVTASSCVTVKPEVEEKEPERAPEEPKEPEEEMHSMPLAKEPVALKPATLDDHVAKDKLMDNSYMDVKPQAAHMSANNLAAESVRDSY